MSFVQASLQTVRQEQFHPNQAAAMSSQGHQVYPEELQLHFSRS
jgi:hypothetical protein